jgi:hypothetical protein
VFEIIKKLFTDESFISKLRKEQEAEKDAQENDIFSDSSAFIALLVNLLVTSDSLSHKFLVLSFLDELMGMISSYERLLFLLYSFIMKIFRGATHATKLQQK